MSPLHFGWVLIWYSSPELWYQLEFHAINTINAFFVNVKCTKFSFGLNFATDLAGNYSALSQTAREHGRRESKVWSR